MSEGPGPTHQVRGNITVNTDNRPPQITRSDLADPAALQARLDAGADPDRGSYLAHGRPLHEAADSGLVDALRLLLPHVTDVDADSAYDEGRTALWVAVYENHRDAVRLLLDAGADPWRPMMAGWSPGRLALAGPNADLFENLPGAVPLTPTELAAVAEGRRLSAVLDGVDSSGWGLACVADLTAAEAIRRLNAEPAPEIAAMFADPDPDDDPEEWYDEEGPYALVMGISDVPGGCVLAQSWLYGPSMPGIHTRLSVGTRSYGLYQNPKSGSQGSIYRDGAEVGWDLSPGLPPEPDDPADAVLRAYLHGGNAVAVACAFAGLRLTDSNVLDSGPDTWIRLPRLNYWVG